MVRFGSDEEESEATKRGGGASEEKRSPPFKTPSPKPPANAFAHPKLPPPPTLTHRTISNTQVRCYVGDNEQRWFMWYSARDSPAPPGGSVAAVAPGAGAVGLATSGDGVLWQRWSAGAGAGGPPPPLPPLAAPPPSAAAAAAAPSPGAPILEPNGDWWWHDTHHVAVSDVQIFSSGAVAAAGGVYWMFYSGGSFERHPLPAGITSTAGAGAGPGAGAGAAASGPRASRGEGPAAAGEAAPEGEPGVEGARTRAGLALSQDGRHWARIEADHHSGALLDAGGAGAWDAAFVAAPQVVAAGPRDMRMYYHSFDERARRWTVGVSRSEDGLRWSRGEPVFRGGGDAGGESPPSSASSSSFDAAGAASRHVVFDPAARQYVMFYEAVAADDSRSIGVAVSEDGLGGWRRASDRPVLEASPASAGSSSPPRWDDGGVGAPCVVPMAGGKWRLYYSGRAKGSAPGAWCGVGLALMDDAAFAADGAAGGDGAPPGSSEGPAVAGLAGARWRRRSASPPPGVVARGAAVAAGAAAV